MTLDSFLSEDYNERVLRHPSPVARRLHFKRALENTPGLKEEAQRRLAGLTDDVCKRCFISKMQRAALSEILTP